MLQRKKKSGLEKLTEHPSVINLAKTIIEDPNPNLRCVTVELVDSLFRCDAEKHFSEVDTLWKDGHFFMLLIDEFSERLNLAQSLSFRMNETRSDLFELRGNDVLRDPELNFVLGMRKPADRMRGALSILIGYWCLEFKLEDYFTGDLGLYGLGIESISFAKSDCEYPLPPDDPWKSQEGMKAEKRAGDPDALAKEERDSKRRAKSESTIGQLINVPSISRLAEEITLNYPGIVEVAESFLKSLEEAPPFVEEYLSYFPHRKCAVLRKAMRAFWGNEDLCELLLRHIIEDPCLLAIMKIFSYRSTREIALLHTEFILQRYGSKSFFTAPNCDLEHRIRLALAILFEHWTCMGVLMRVREQINLYYEHGQTIKNYAEFHAKPIGEVIFRPCIGAGVHNDPVSAANDVTHLMDLLSRWNEENQTETNHLLEKDLSKVLTSKYNADKTMIDGLLEKMNSKPAGSRMRMELKNVPGLGLSMTCSF